jgi:hypothetical protein
MLRNSNNCSLSNALGFPSLSVKPESDHAGKSFPGVTSQGTWLLALFDGPALNPAPTVMTVLKPCAPQH